MKKTALPFLLILIFLVPSLASAQITYYYGRKEGVNPAAFTLTIYSPNDQTAYVNTMLLNFNITWTTFSSFIAPVGPPLKGDYAYSIDDNPIVPIGSNQSASDLFYVNFNFNPHFSSLVNVSKLANGYHKIVIIAGLYKQSDYYYINQSCTPTLFLVQNPTSYLSSAPIPTPTLTPTSNPVLNVSLSESASALNYGNKVNFTVLADGGTKPYTFAWYIDGQMVQTGGSQYFSTDSQAIGSHHVYVQVTDADNNSAATLTVEFNVLPFSNLSPSSSPAQQPTLTQTAEPFPIPIFSTPTPTAEPFSTTSVMTVVIVVVIATIVLVVLIIVALMRYMVKSKNAKS
jgi:hypothetical protein